MNLIFLGPPGVGKGTVAKLVQEKKGIPQISTGDLLRDAVKRETELGKKAKTYMDKGQLVPDDLVINLLKEKIKEPQYKDGFILDGFPRTIPQAKSLDQSDVDIDKAVNFQAERETIIQRITGRRTCKNCGAIYHIENIPPKKEGICDKCSEELFQRDDDKLEAVKERLKVYQEQTAPLIDYYEKKEILVNIDAEQDLDKIITDVLDSI